MFKPAESNDREAKLRPIKSQPKTTNPLVSVIVPTLNRPAMLKEALASIASQTYTPIEIIVVNDAGVEVEDVISALRFNQRIVYLKHATNKGLPAARNTGLKAASGDYVAYLDDDDIYYPDHIQTLVSFLLATDYKVAYTDSYQADQCKLQKFLRNFFTIHNQSSRRTALLYSLSRIAPRWGLKFLYQISRLLTSHLDAPFMKLNNCGIDMFSRGDGKYLIVKRTHQFSEDFARDTMLVRNFIPVLCLMHHRSCLERTGLFDETLTTHEDWDLWIRMSRENDFAHIKKVTCEYSRRADGSNITSAIRADFKRTMEVIYERYSHLTRSPKVADAQRAFLQKIKDELARGGL
jgi:glycosyltransferase involved in cell wall biosynthesis